MILWAIKSPEGDYSMFRKTEGAAVQAFSLMSPNPWGIYLRQGYRAVEVELREIGNE